MPFNTTTGATFLRTVWSKMVVDAREAAYVMKSRVANRSGELSMGQVLRVPLRSALTATTVTAATGAYTAVDVTDTYSDVTVNQWYHCVTRVVDNMESLSDRDLGKLYAPKQGTALAKIIDSYLLGKYASYAEAFSQADVTMDGCITAAATLDNSNVPADDRFCVLSPLQYWKLFGEASVSDAAALGVGQSPLITAKLPKLLGIEWFSSTQVPTSTTRKNFMWQKDALALVVADSVTMEKVRASDVFATDYRCYELFGATAERTDHGLILATTNVT
jgi:hypothetical protein